MVTLSKYFQNPIFIPKFVKKYFSLAKQKIVITGGPSTGKTSIINNLEQLGETCYHEISRAITLEAQKQGVEQLFIKDPTLFSKKLLEGRINQFFNAEKDSSQRIFIDRGIPDIVAYMNYAHVINPIEFIHACEQHTYDFVFLLPPWEKIHITDNERYENFEEAVQIHKHLFTTYREFGYNCIEVPFGNVKERSTFILQHLI